jgi:hypothetical protein
MLLDNNFQSDHILPVWKEGAVNEELPAQLHEFFETFEVNPEFTATIQSFNNEHYTGRPSIIGEYRGELPNYEKLVKINGPKWYRYKIMYKENGITKKQTIDVDLSSKNWHIVAKEGDRERAQIRKEQIKEDMEERNALMAYGGMTNQDPMSNVKQTVDTIAPLLAILKGDNGKSSGDMGMKEMMMFMMTMQQQSQNQMMQMFGMQAKGNSDMMVAMLGNRQPDQTDKLFTMAERMFQMKELITPKEEGLIDKIGNFIGSNIDAIGGLLQKPENHPDRQEVENSWKMKAIKKKMAENKHFAGKLIEHLDKKLGNSEVTDKLLDGFIKYKRHEAMEETPAETVEATEKTNDDISPDDFE